MSLQTYDVITSYDVKLSVIETDLRREMNKCSDMGSMSRYLVLSRQQMLLEVQLAFYRVRLRLINCRQFQTASMIQFSYNTAFKCLKNLTQKSATKIWNYLDLSLKTCLGWFSFSIVFLIGGDVMQNSTI